MKQPNPAGRAFNGLLFTLALLALAGVALLVSFCQPSVFIPPAPITRAPTLTETPRPHPPTVTASPFLSPTPADTATDAPTVTPPPSQTPTETRAFPTFSPPSTFTVTPTPTAFQTDTPFPTLSHSVTPIATTTPGRPTKLPNTGASQEMLFTSLLYPLLLFVLAGVLLVMGGILLTRQGKDNVR